jgi:hypothetical protein
VRQLITSSDSGPNNRGWVPPSAPKNDAELRDYLADTFSVRLPDKKCCENHSTPFRAFSDAYFAAHSVTVWEGSRGFAGKSHALALLTITEALTLAANVNLLGGSGEQAARVLEAMGHFWNAPNAPHAALLSDPGKRETRFRSGNWVRALMASTKSARGPHPQRLRIDEVDETTIVILDAAMGQTMSLAGVPAQTVLSSTHQYANGTMTEVKKRAKDKGWPIFTWCYRECLEPHGWLAKAEVGRKQAEVTSAMWAAEYELQEPNPEGRAINVEAVEAMFDAKFGIHVGADGEDLIFEEPVEGATYATGADWAKKKDNTILWTERIDVTPTRLVAFRRMHRLAWPIMIKAFDDRVTRYPGAAAHDATGIGDVIDGYIECAAEAVILVGRVRTEVFADHIQSIEHNERRAPRVEFALSEHKYVSNDDLYGAGHPPDSFVAAALCHYAATKGGGFFGFIKQKHADAQKQKEGK